ncbi:ShET2/EspL2 family type III secretion system effector toxin [Pantoea cypripedii]|uniref:ShET2 enterotoxin N-terminal domain-containing protein n=1 Tax=Pantoea cypripedii TaxID=55209 RepID=A0A6B9G4R3_PANCY|nr:ShET2/EspL2 family type III secretion system effector toxin [Pantoea cypripedii]QGY32018.1 hypothetical protein CUN67_23755 [Pantoea cypripedii]
MPIESIARCTLLEVIDEVAEDDISISATSVKNVNDKPSFYTISPQPIVSRLDIVKAKFNDDSAFFLNSATSVKCNNFAMNFIDVFLANTPDAAQVIKSLSLSTQNAGSIAKNISINTQERTLAILAHGKENYLVDYQLWGEFFYSEFLKMQNDKVLIKPFLIYSRPHMIKENLHEFTVGMHHTMALVLSCNNGAYQIAVYDPTHTTGYFATEMNDLSGLSKMNIFSFINKEDSIEFVTNSPARLINGLSYFTAVPGYLEGSRLSLLHERNDQRDICNTFLTTQTKISQQELFYAALTGLSVKDFVFFLRHVPVNERAEFLTIKGESGKTILSFLAGLPDKDCHLLRNYFSFIKEALRAGLLDKQEVIKQLSKKVVEDVGYAWFEVTLFGRAFLRSNTGKVAEVFATEVINLIKENRLTEEEGKTILDDMIVIKEKEGGVMSEYPGFEFAKLKHHIHASDAGEMIRKNYPAWYFDEQ